MIPPCFFLACDVNQRHLSCIDLVKQCLPDTPLQEHSGERWGHSVRSFELRVSRLHHFAVEASFMLKISEGEHVSAEKSTTRVGSRLLGLWY